MGGGGEAGPKIEEVNLRIDWQIQELVTSLNSVDETHHFVFPFFNPELEYFAK